MYILSIKWNFRIFIKSEIHDWCDKILSDKIIRNTTPKRYNAYMKIRFTIHNLNVLEYKSQVVCKPVCTLGCFFSALWPYILPFLELDLKMILPTFQLTRENLWTARTEFILYWINTKKTTFLFKRGLLSIFYYYYYLWL